MTDSPTPIMTDSPTPITTTDDAAEDEQPNMHRRDSERSRASSTDQHFFDAEQSGDETPAVVLEHASDHAYDYTSSQVFSDTTTDVIDNTTPASSRPPKMPSTVIEEVVPTMLAKVWTYTRQIPETWPRLFSLAFGVVCPVLLLIAISLFFGYFLSHYESLAEIENNNAIIGERAKIAAVSQFLGNVSSQVPRICLGIAVRNGTTADDFPLEEEIKKELFEIYTRDDTIGFNLSAFDDIRGIDVEEVQNLFLFMRKCGDTVWKKTEDFTVSQYGFSGEIGDIGEIGGLSFNWIRCYAQADTEDDSHFNRLFGSYVRHPLTNITQLRPDLQEAVVVEAWDLHQQELEEQYLEELMANVNFTDDNPMFDERVEARIEAYQKSVQDADGFGGCESNPDAGAWFWFTIMTTIG